ncbi:MAG: hypothetical protein HC894_12660 [Microcoleus sp. SM1_3_4]|nr:hypothetical protein [Microcoleus sp. SM1_3_4]
MLQNLAVNCQLSTVNCLTIFLEAAQSFLARKPSAIEQQTNRPNVDHR